MVEIPNIEVIKSIINVTKHTNIDIKDIISKTMNFCPITDEFYVLDSNCIPISNQFMQEGLEYDSFSDSYFDYVDKLIDDDGVYIVLLYATKGAGYDKTIKYDVEGLDENEIFHAEISTWCLETNLELPEDSPSTRNIDERDDYGILLTREDGKLKITYAYNEYSPCGPCGYNEIHEIENELENPVFRLVIMLMFMSIVPKEVLNNISM